MDDDFLAGDRGNDIINGEFTNSSGLNQTDLQNLLSFLSATNEENTLDEELTVETRELLNPENFMMLLGMNLEELDFDFNGILDLDENEFKTDNLVSVTRNFTLNPNQLNIRSFFSSNDTQLGGDGNDTLNGDFDFGSQFRTPDFFSFFNGNDVQIGGNGNDNLRGGAGNDRLNGTGDRYGIGEIDNLTGSSGQDTFVLGNRENVFYSEQNVFDYASITDFEVGQDTIKLRGEIADYFLAPTTGDLPQGTGLYLNINGSENVNSEAGELIAISTQTISSLENGFIFV